MTIVFSPKYDMLRLIDLSSLIPEFIFRMTDDEISKLWIYHGSDPVEVGDLFNVKRLRHDSGLAPVEVIFEDTNTCYERIGNGMTFGTIKAYGHVGTLLGCGMSGGVIAISGSASDFCANSMAGGRIYIGGDCGDYLGSGAPGAKHGMNGGCVVVYGDTGARLGNRMRRGMIIVHGNAGVGACSAMVAGTVLLLGETQENLGVQMRRGSVLCAHSPSLPNDRFHQQIFTSDSLIPIIQQCVNGIEESLNLSEQFGNPKFRFVGDISYGGMGEVIALGE